MSTPLGCLDWICPLILCSGGIAYVTDFIFFFPLVKLRLQVHGMEN